MSIGADNTGVMSELNALSSDLHRATVPISREFLVANGLNVSTVANKANSVAFVMQRLNGDIMTDYMNQLTHHNDSGTSLGGVMEMAERVKSLIHIMKKPVDSVEFYETKAELTKANETLTRVDPLIKEIDNLGCTPSSAKDELEKLKRHIRDKVNSIIIGRYNWKDVHSLEDLIHAAVGVIPRNPRYMPVYTNPDEAAVGMVTNTKPMTRSWMTAFGGVDGPPPLTTKRQRVVNPSDAY